MQRKFILRQIYTLLCIACSVGILIFIIRSELTTFHFVLYRRRDYLNVDTVITQNLIPKLTFGTILIVLGIFCYVFYLSVLKENTLLIVVRYLFYSAGLISCLWEYETLFYIDRLSRRIWIRSGDILFLLLNVTFVELLLSERPHRKLCQLWEKLVYVMFFAMTAFVDVLYAKMRNSDNLFRDRNKILLLAYIIVILAVFIYLYYYRKFHLRMCLSKDVNQKIRFANKYKYEITNRLIETVEHPIHVLEGLNEILVESGAQCAEREDHILDSMNYEISKIKKSLGYLKNNSLLVENAYNLEKVKVNLNLVLREMMESINGEGQCRGRYVFVNDLPDETFVNGDPYYLADALGNIVKELIAVSTDREKVRIWAGEVGEEVIQIELKAEYQESMRKRVNYLYHLFRNKELLHNTSNEESIYLISARNLMLLHQSVFSVKKGPRTLALQCRLLVCKDPIARVSSSGQTDIEEGKKIVVLISNQAEQIALVSSYLASEPFFLQIFNTGTEAVEYLSRTPNITLVLVAEILFNMTCFEICDEIRKLFSLAQLSVVLISRKMRYINDNRLKNFNDVLEGTFSRHQLLLKLYGAVRLKQAEAELSRYQIDFLQSQMNPHFVFNTISTIMPLCLQNPMEAYGLLEYFAEYLRGNLFAGNLHSKVTLQREIDLIEAFLGIEKVRFQGMVEADIQVSCDDSTLILPLLIEPLVENCVVHARIPGRVLRIEIKITEGDKGLSVSVSDNGAGMSKEQIEDVYQMNNAGSFGLANVIKRLRLYYQEELNISSDSGTGTSIAFCIPNNQNKGKKVG